MITEKNHISLLTENKIELINSMNDIKKLFSPESLISGENPKINIDYDCLILFDTPTYNSNYLAELILKYLKVYNKLTYPEIAKIFNFSHKNIALEIDIVNDLKQKIITQTNRTKIFYCQDDNIYAQLFENYLNQKLKPLNPNNKLQIPLLLTIKGNVKNGKEKDIIIDFENISTLGYNNIIKNMLYLYDYNNIIIN